MEEIKQKTRDANQFKVLKVKLGGEDDKNIINTIRLITDRPIYVDANQSWKDKYYALDMINWLHDKNIELIEQPMPKNQLSDMEWLTQRSPLPTIADESFQGLEDIEKLKGVYSGINIKLMKSKGLLEAKKTIQQARSNNMKIMLGCMTETSCAISAAAHLSSLVDWVDLDGNLLITNDVYNGVKIQKGKITLNSLPGIGILKK
jgi:L-alanine-DL-glutamate epimerase-like enolase superfamily enzyme